MIATIELRVRLSQLPATAAGQRAELQQMHRLALRGGRTPAERALGLMQAAKIRNRIRRIK